MNKREVYKVKTLGSQYGEQYGGRRCLQLRMLISWGPSYWWNYWYTLQAKIPMMQLRELNFLSDVMRWMRWKTICEFLGRKYRYFSFSYEDLSFTWVLRKMISSWNAKELAAAANWSVNCGKFLGNRNALGLGILPNMVVFIPETLPTVFLCGVVFLTSIDFSAFIKADGFRHAVKCRLSWVS